MRRLILILAAFAVLAGCNEQLTIDNEPLTIEDEPAQILPPEPEQTEEPEQTQELEPEQAKTPEEPKPPESPIVGEDDWRLANYGANRNQPPLISGTPLQNDSIKIDPSKPFVYEAEFSPFIYNEGSEIFAVFPFINIDSPDAEGINNNTKSSFESTQNILEDELIMNIGIDLFTGYDVYYNGDIMSVVCFRVGALTDVPRWDYWSYNIDLNTGELLTFEQLCKTVGLSLDEANELAEAKINAILQNNAERYRHNEEAIEQDTKISLARFRREDTGREWELESPFPRAFFMADGVIYYFMYIEIAPVHWGYYPKIFSINDDEIYAPKTIEKHSYV
jgi:hypothetical protein